MDFQVFGPRGVYHDLPLVWIYIGYAPGGLGVVPDLRQWKRAPSVRRVKNQCMEEMDRIVMQWLQNLSGWDETWSK